MTPEEIAEKVAKSMVRAEPWERTGNSYVDIGEEGMDQDLAAGMIERHEAVLIYAEDCRKFFTAKILEAIETALHQCPVPGGLSDAELDEYRNFARQSLTEWESIFAGAQGITAELASANIAARQRELELLTHIDHLHRIMHTPESESIARAYDEGYQKGCRETIDKFFNEKLVSVDGTITGDFGIISSQNHHPEEP